MQHFHDLAAQHDLNDIHKMSDESQSSAPRAFISYSWSSPTHEAWVINLATRLREDGVDVILDKWDLKPGHDAYAFMESMVTDKTVRKVIMVCDKIYVDKANSRTGGVGTESQIISPELYGKGKQDKYAALMTEEDDEGNAYIPVFYKGRVYFDFRSQQNYEESYEQLLRWLVDKPQHIKPKLGAIPQFIIDPTPVASATQSRARRTEEAIRQQRTGIPALIHEYGDALELELKSLSPQLSDAEPFDETILQATYSMQPYARQFSEIVNTAIRFDAGDVVWDRILRILERLGTLMFRDAETTRWYSQQFDAYKIICHRMYLETIALALDEERFDLISSAINRPYLIRNFDGGNQPATSDFTIFRQYVESLESRKRRLSLNRITIEGDLLKDAFPSGSIPSFESIMQADFVLYLSASAKSTSYNWFPYSLVYATNRFSPFPIFARSESKAYFSRVISIFGVNNLEDFKALLSNIDKDGRGARLFDFQGLPVSYLANAQHLCSLD